MRRGTTPTNIFNTDVSLVGCDVLYITYKQNDKTVIEKALDDCAVEDDKVTVTLTQEETLALNDIEQVNIQIRAGYPDGSRLASNILRVPVGRILKQGVI